MAGDCRAKIVHDFAQWTALSALRSGAPIKSRHDVYGAMEQIKFAELFELGAGLIDSTAFDAWHEREVAGLSEREPRLNAGWAAKIVNIYLKTRVYVGREGRPGLTAAIHPPIDGGLWRGIRERFGVDHPDLVDAVCSVERINKIEDYARYRRIIAGCRLAAAQLGCELIEVEQLWKGTVAA